MSYYPQRPGANVNRRGRPEQPGANFQAPPSYAGQPQQPYPGQPQAPYGMPPQQQPQQQQGFGQPGFSGQPPHGQQPPQQQQQPGYGGGAPQQSFQGGQGPPGGPMHPPQQRQPNYGGPSAQGPGHPTFGNQPMPQGQGPPQQRQQNFAAPQGPPAYGGQQMHPQPPQNQQSQPQQQQQQPGSGGFVQPQQKQPDNFPAPAYGGNAPANVRPPLTSPLTKNPPQPQANTPAVDKDNKIYDLELENAVNNCREEEFNKMFASRYKDDSMKKKEMIPEPICLIPMPGVQMRSDNRNRGRQDYKKGRKNDDRDRPYR